MKISIALTTYNGADYLREQLDSIKKQTLQPDEVIIVDDVSSDGTLDLVNEYIKDNNLSSKWIVFQNKQNVGWKVNFRKAIELCSGDIVFLCDQDDIWEEDKIESMFDVIRDNPGIDVLASNYMRIDHRGTIIDNSLSNKKAISKLCLMRFGFIINRPGCTYCFRKKIMDEIKGIDNEDIPHDTVLWIISIIKGTLFLYNKVTTRYRFHRNSTTQCKNGLTIESIIKELLLQDKCIAIAISFCEINKEYGLLIPSIRSLENSNRCRIQYLQEHSFMMFWRNVLTPVKR